MRLLASLRGMSARGRIKLTYWTILGTAGCIVVAVSINYTLFLSFDEAVRKRAVLSAVVITILLAAPLFFYLTLKLRELAIVNYKLADAAATDFLTRCLNRGSFSARVEKWLADGGDDEAVAGALLVIDADHFKKINDRFGHYEGDMALKAIAHAIRSAVRKTDLVGRLGGEEFGVFLPGATERGAASVAERIRQRVNRVAFRPGGEICPLSVSVGCAAFTRRVGFSELFRVADERLYEAKSAGRNRIMLTRIEVDQPPALALH
ncbi:GGDEF domain-containing protein [Chelativorans alearense]|uniref:GGDEF domain-containing protein n=1 Tax=Chelativorans alearense TaxID=2681495 RepID=UPI001FE60A5F|nr:GGDEF domain-containing protein [Chelativorans alearense]